jgi:hypothetical protein
MGARFSAHRGVFTARSRGQLELFRARREMAELEAELGRWYAELGRAVFEEDETGGEAAKNALGGLTERIRTKEAEIHTLIEPPDEGDPPEPARVPEPTPDAPPPEPERPPTPQGKRRAKRAS